MCSLLVYKSGSLDQKWKPVGNIGSSSSACSWGGNSLSVGSGLQIPHCVLECLKQLSFEFLLSHIL